MNNITDIHPDAVAEAILAASSHPAKRRNVELIHQICKECHAMGNANFSLKSIGRMVEARGGLKAKALWNKQSADYQKLIEAWQAYTGGRPNAREAAKIAPQEAVMRTITDPATRIIVEKLIRERSTLKAEVNILKSQTTFTIDRRPNGASSSTHSIPGSNMAVEVKTGPVLNIVEREALEHAISRELWEAEGWHEEKHGRIVRQIELTGHSRTIFKPGFATAIRKILDNQ